MNFIDFARLHGVEIDNARLFGSERIRRCGTTDKPRSKNGAFYWDGQRGWVCNWATGATVQWFNDPTATPWTEAEKAAWKAKRQAVRESQEASYRQAAQRAAEMIAACKPGPHNYLHRKGFPDAQGLVASDGALLIPMRHLHTNDLQGAQLIRWDEAARVFDKKMVTGMKAKGAVFRMGDKHAAEACLCEGYATGLSIAAAARSAGIRCAVLITFSASNLEHVAQMVQGRAYVFADHDKSGTGQKAAQATGLPFVMSAVEGEDANDLHTRSGLMAVCQKLMEVRRM